MPPTLQVNAVVIGRTVTWELVEIREPDLKPLVPEGDAFDFAEFGSTNPIIEVTAIIRKRAA
jgi:hypothetical protein